MGHSNRHWLPTIRLCERTRSAENWAHFIALKGKTGCGVSDYVIEITPSPFYQNLIKNLWLEWVNHKILPQKINPDEKVTG